MVRGAWWRRALVLAAWASACCGVRAVAAAAAAAGDWRYGGGGGGGASGGAGGGGGGGGGVVSPPTPDAAAGLGVGAFETQALLNATVVERGGARRWEAAAEPGLFGRGRVAAAAGLLVPLLGAACSPNVSAARGVPPGQPWIALVQRGGCTYDAKVANAWLLNASAVVVYNNDDSPALQRMPLEKRNISGIFITKKRGEYLVGLVANNAYVYLNITVGPTQVRSYNINRTSVLFVSISFIVLMMISLAWLVFYYVQRFRYIHAKDRLSRRLCSAARKALSKIPTKVIKTDDKEMQGDYECCAVCIEPYKISDVLRILPCRHEFHKSCIDPWLLEHRTCPMCKMDILKHYGFVFTGSQESILHVEIEEVVGLRPASSPEQELQSPQRTLSPCPRGQQSDQQTPTRAPVDLQIQRSLTCSSEDLQPSTSSGLGTSKHMHSSQHESCAHSSVGTETIPTPLVCSGCGSDIVVTCDAECNTSPLPKEVFISPNNGTSLDICINDYRDDSSHGIDSNAYCDSTCQTASTKQCHGSVSDS